jgi:carbon-monoxide dehydrogenase medium subunit
VKPAPFLYHRPRTLDEALALLAEHGTDAKPLAGGQSLIPAMNFRLATPAVLVDLNEISELRYVTDQAPGAGPQAPGPAPLRIGAMTRHRAVERDPVIRANAPLLTRTMPFVAHPAIRTRGTIGGSLAHADPAAELPAVMLALNAAIVLSSRAGSRTVAAEDFFIGLFTTTLEPGELLTEVVVPSPLPNTRVAFNEISRRHGDFALAGVAAAMRLDPVSHRIVDARIGLLSVGDRPTLATKAAQALSGQLPAVETFRAAADTAANEDIDPPGDIHASARYRRQLVRVLVRRTLEEAL